MIGDKCVFGVCFMIFVDCNDDEICIIDFCELDIGCVYVFVDLVCDDGFICIV